MCVGGGETERKQRGKGKQKVVRGNKKGIVVVTLQMYVYTYVYICKYPMHIGVLIYM